MDLVQRPVVDFDLDVEPVRLLIVHREMFHTGRYTVALHALNVRNDHGRGQERIFAHVFEVAPVERRAIDVDSGTQQHGFVAVAGLFADRLSVSVGQGRIPCRGKAGKGWECRTRVARPSRVVPFVPQLFGTDAVRSVAHPHFGDPEARNAGRAEFRLCMAQRYLLFEGHACEGVFDPLFDRSPGIEIGGFGVCRGLGGGTSCLDSPQGRQTQKGGNQLCSFHRCRKIKV